MNATLKSFFWSKIYRPLDELWFDVKYNIQTKGEILPHQIETRFNTQPFAEAYQPVSTKTINRIFQDIAALKLSAPQFVDIGCGKGKAVFYAANTGLFERAGGIDFCHTFIDDAQRNLKHFTGNQSIPLWFETGDASEYQIPDEQCILFFFNPFNETILNRFIANNKERIQRHQSTVIYANDIYLPVFLNQGFQPLLSNSQFHYTILQLPSSQM